MATLVLTFAGGVLGGPIGAAIGAIGGSLIDREVLFKPKARAGPRLNDIKVQTSSYGTQLPKLFGTMRVAGCVIWATDLQEHRTTTGGGGKGKTATTTYSYTASFAVALSTRAIKSVGRIWADGKLLRGAAGDWKTRTGFRLYLGTEAQGADPLIAAYEGFGRAPAHRGMAYAVFEHLDLADFGNRIPSLSFEVVADFGAVEAGAIVNEIGAGIVRCEEATTALHGFSAYGASARAVVETLAGATSGWFGAQDGLRLLSGDGQASALSDKGIKSTRSSRRSERSIAAPDSAPSQLSLIYYEPARDYQSGVQRAARASGDKREVRMELPAAIHASTAKALAEAALSTFDIERTKRSVTLGWDHLHIPPGARVTIAGEAGIWRVERWMLENMVVKLECTALAPAPIETNASPGRSVQAPDLQQGQTLLYAFELPALEDAPTDSPRLAIAAAGSQSGWRGAALLMSDDAGARWQAIGNATSPATLGTLIAPPGVGSPWMFDAHNAIDIVLAHPDMVLSDADPEAIDRGANLALVGDELIQFAKADFVEGARWRLRALCRGVRATERAIGTQQAGDRFVLIQAESLIVQPLPSAAIGSTQRILAQGISDGGEGVMAEVPIAGRAIVPPAPVHLRAQVSPDGFVSLRWARRSRIGWRWIDGMDVPLGEENERYRVEIAPAGALARFVVVESPYYRFAAFDLERPIMIRIQQIGTHGLSALTTYIVDNQERDA